MLFVRIKWEVTESHSNTTQTGSFFFFLFSLKIKTTVDRHIREPSNGTVAPDKRKHFYNVWNINIREVGLCVAVRRLSKSSTRESWLSMSGSLSEMILF